MIREISVLALTANLSFSAFAEKTVVGVVDWDCSLPSDTWFGHYATTSLSPARFRYATPFYADVKGSDKIDYHWRTVEEYEREMQYAIDAGIDYFAYCWYGELKDGKDFTPVGKDNRIPCCDRHIWELATARQLHAKSRLRDKLKMCAILVVLHPLADAELEALAQAMKENWYQKAAGRPLLYLYGQPCAPILTRLRTICSKVGAGDPYAVGLTGQGGPLTGMTSIQAKSSYTCCANGVTNFAQVVDQTLRENGARAATGIPVIPNFVVGWDPSPRLVNPVPWCNYYKTSYAPPATEEELLDGAMKMVGWIKANRAACPTGHILTFAWNEFEEGGWICPIWRAGGDPDTSRLQAFRKVADIWRHELDK